MTRLISLVIDLQEAQLHISTRFRNSLKNALYTADTIDIISRYISITYWHQRWNSICLFFRISITLVAYVKR